MSAPKLTLAAIIAGSACLILPACQTGGTADIGAPKYIGGEAVDTENVSLDQAWYAAHAAIKELQFKPRDQSRDAIQGWLTANTADNTGVRVTFKSIGDNLTRFRVRVGLLGNEDQSRIIMEHIRKSL